MKETKKGMSPTECLGNMAGVISTDKAPGPAPLNAGKKLLNPDGVVVPPAELAEASSRIHSAQHAHSTVDLGNEIISCGALANALLHSPAKVEVPKSKPLIKTQPK